MNKNQLLLKSRAILQRMRDDLEICSFIDASLGIPEVFRGMGDIRLIILGQDPTVKNPLSRQGIQCVLNLDRKGNLWNYLNLVCRQLDMDLTQNVYATNLFKNFFIEPPTQIKEINIFQKGLPYWLQLLKDELSEFPSAPVITLGEPLLSVLVTNPKEAKVREYWGFVPDWKQGKRKSFSYLSPDQNILARAIFPFPHQPSLRKTFYRECLSDYIAFMKSEMI